MVRLYHHPGAEEFPERLDGPKAEENADKNEDDAEGEEARKTHPDVELRRRVGQIETQRDARGEDDDHEGCAAAIV